MMKWLSCRPVKSVFLVQIQVAEPKHYTRRLMGLINGYEHVYQPKHHRATYSGMVYKHILVAESMLGRKLKPHEVIHHINGKRSDNRPENIMIMFDNVDHLKGRVLT